MRTQSLSRDALLDLQTTKLRELLAHAHACCPAYRRRIDEAGIDPARAALSDLAALPTIDKAALRAATPDIRDRRRLSADQRYGPFCDPRTPGGLHRYTTGGSTGDPLVFYIDRRRQAADQAARSRSRRWFGIDVGERELYVWGAPAELTAQDRLRRWRDRLANHVLINAFDMTAERMETCLDRIEGMDPVHVFGYPSSLARLVRNARTGRRAVHAPSLRTVFVTGEVLALEDRVAIGEYFGVAVADGYGSREAGFIAHECPAGRMHVTMESVIVELLDARGRPVPAAQTGEITVTHLDAFGMPFIRYRTGDLACWDPRPCPCGLALATLSAIEGRRGDAIRTPDGAFAHPLSVIYPLRECARIRQFRVRQRRDYALDVSIVPTVAFTTIDREQLVERIARQFRGRISVRVHIVDHIPPDPSGKHCAVRSDIPEPDAAPPPAGRITSPV
ncbi:MAG: AMP-binding protein [Phycisphaerae bacterium]